MLFIVYALGVGLFDVALMYVSLRALLSLAERHENKFLIRQSCKLIVLLVALLPFPLTRFCLSRLRYRDHERFSQFGGIWLLVLLFGLAMWGSPLAKQIKIALSHDEP